MNYGSDVVRKVLTDLGVQIDYWGSGWTSCKCPIHVDKKPSFSVHLSEGGWICYEGCGKSGDLATLVQQCQGGDLRKIQNKLNSMYSDTPGMLNNIFNPLPSQQKDTEPLFYERNKMYPYMFERGFTKEILKEWNVGIDTDTQSVVLPVTDKGKLVGLVRRNIFKKEYLNSYGMDKENILFGLDKVPDEITSIIVLESPMDVLWCRQHGYYAVATMGGPVTDGQMKLLLRRFFRLILAFDQDAAGERFLSQSEKLLKGKVMYSIAKFPEFKKDPGDCNSIQLAKTFGDLV